MQSTASAMLGRAATTTTGTRLTAGEKPPRWTVSGSATATSALGGPPFAELSTTE